MVRSRCRNAGTATASREPHFAPAARQVHLNSQRSMQRCRTLHELSHHSPSILARVRCRWRNRSCRLCASVVSVSYGTHEVCVPPDQRPWREWYQLERWRRRRRAQLQAHPLCAMCSRRGVVTAATVADHVVSHRGDWNAFITGELQSLCATCHNSSKKLLDHRGYLPDVAENGWPTDPRHPANKHSAHHWRNVRPRGAS